MVAGGSIIGFEGADITLYDAAGRNIPVQKELAADGRIQLRFGKAAPGLYLLRIVSESGMVVHRKFVVE